MSEHAFNFETESGQMKIDICLGKFDALVVPDFLKALDSEWSDCIHSVVVDLSQVSFIDSSGVGALLAVRKKVADQPDPVTLLKPQEHVVSVLEMLRLHRVFKLA